MANGLCLSVGIRCKQPVARRLQRLKAELIWGEEGETLKFPNSRATFNAAETVSHFTRENYIPRPLKWKLTSYFMRIALSDFCLLQKADLPVALAFIDAAGRG